MTRTLRTALLGGLGILWAVGALAPPGLARADDEMEQATAPDGIYAVLETDLGTIVCRLLFERAPLTVANFVGLAEGTLQFREVGTGELVRRPFYQEILFHRVIEDFMIQTGDPTGTGNGGPGYHFRDELDTGLSHDRPGTLSMANAGANSNGSQFFITEVPTPWLDGRHSIFGRVVFGLDVVSAIADSEVEGSRPVDPLYLQRVSILRRGDGAEEFDAEAVFEELEDLSPSEQSERRAAEFATRLEELRGDSLPREDGSRYTVVEEGEGVQPTPGQTIRVHYVCYLPDGSVVESTRRRARSMRLVAGEPRRGLDWELWYLEMKPGERRWVFLPPELGFGDRGIPGVVPPGSPLILDLELESILED